MEQAVRFESVEKRFGGTLAVRDLSFTVPRGAICGFLGPNGAGKSTTVRMLMSILMPDSGRIEVLNDTAARQKDRIGYLPETRGLYPKMRVSAYLEYIARLKGVVHADLGARVLGWLERMALGHVAAQPCRTLSKGMQQKVQILASLIHEPELLILDEPFSGLDPIAVEQLGALIAELRSAGTTLMISTHVLHQAERLCDHIVLLDRGTKLLDAPLTEIRERFSPRTVEVELLSPEASLSVPPGCEATAGPEPGVHALLLPPGGDPQAVMRAVLETQAVRHIAVRRATLHEVFVRLVEGR